MTCEAFLSCYTSDTNMQLVRHWFDAGFLTGKHEARHWNKPFSFFTKQFIISFIFLLFNYIPIWPFLTSNIWIPWNTADSVTALFFIYFLPHRHLTFNLFCIFAPVPPSRSSLDWLLVSVSADVLNPAELCLEPGGCLACCWGTSEPSCGCHIFYFSLVLVSVWLGLCLFIPHFLDVLYPYY